MFWPMKNSGKVLSKLKDIGYQVTSFVSQFVLKCLTAKLLKQGYRYHMLRKAFSKFHRRHYELISKFNVRLKSLLHQSLSEPEFYVL